MHSYGYNDAQNLYYSSDNNLYYSFYNNIDTENPTNTIFCWIMQRDDF